MTQEMTWSTCIFVSHSVTCCNSWKSSPNMDSRYWKEKVQVFKIGWIMLPLSYVYSSDGINKKYTDREELLRPELKVINRWQWVKQKIHFNKWIVIFLHKLRLTVFALFDAVNLHSIKAIMWQIFLTKINYCSHSESLKEGYSASMLLPSQSAPIVEEKEKINGRVNDIIQAAHFTSSRSRSGLLAIQSHRKINAEHVGS